jgi:Common central domain of tyrosinase
MHATYATPAMADWNGCQHGNWFFLPWHRIYLYFFERIVRAAVTAAGGPTDFALPYWNYNLPSPGNTIPPAWRAPTLPDSTPNPLYLAPPLRASSYMAGAAFDPSATSPAVAPADTVFARMARERTSPCGTGNTDLPACFPLQRIWRRDAAIGALSLIGARTRSCVRRPTYRRCRWGAMSPASHVERWRLAQPLGGNRSARPGSGLSAPRRRRQ